MELTRTLLNPDVQSLLCLTVAIAAVGVAGTSWLRRHRPSVAARSPAAATSGLVYNDPPTVRVVDSQRVDRMRKVVRLKVGEYIDLLETPAGLEPRFRVRLKGMVQRRDCSAAHIYVAFNGTQLSCGPLVTETGFNEFIVPRAGRDEHRCSVFHYRESGDSLDFMRIRVRSTEPADGTAELDVMHVLGHWPSADAAAD
jgi:hypothetical protein